MPVKLSIEVRGLEKLTKMASRFPDVSQKHVDKAIVRSIGEIDRKTKPITPVKSARLRNSLRPVFRPFRGVYGTNVPYAADVHDLDPPGIGNPYENPSKNKQAVAGFLTVGVKRARMVTDEAFKNALDQIVIDLAK